MKKIYIGTSREIGKKCIRWAKNHLPHGYILSDNIDDCDIFVSVMYEKLLTKEYLKKHPSSFNFHPGILPEYRGAATYSWAIVNGEREAGVTLHKIDEGIDSGDIIDIWKFPITEEDTAETLFRRAEKRMFSMFQFWFSRIVEGCYIGKKQDSNKARIYYKKDLVKIKDLTRFVRALTFNGKESAFYFNSSGVKIYINYEKN